jgi:hypothetical protein
VLLTPRHFVWASFLIQWVRDVCEDNDFRNTQLVLSTIGLLPFLHLLTLWDGRGVLPGTTSPGAAGTGLGAQETVEHWSAGVKLQQRLAKVIRQFLCSDCGHVAGQAKGAAVSPLSLPSGFDASHFQTLLSFCASCLRPQVNYL